jgi:tetratricopeptide (TPR) repeat protein
MVLVIASMIPGISRASESVEYRITSEPAETSAQDPIRDAFAKSYAYEAAGKYREAIDALEPARDVSQQEYLLNLRLGWLAYLSGDYESAGEHYRQVIDAAPAATEPRVGYLLPLLAQQRYADAESVAREVLAIDPKNYYANLRLAYALRSQGKLAEAEQIASSTAELQPTDVTLLTELATIYDAEGRDGEAREIFGRILMLAPNNALAREHLGLPAPSIASELGELGQAPSTEPVGECSGTCYPLTASVCPYYAYLDYGLESIKSHGNTWGVYGRVAALNALEAAYEFTKLGFRDGSDLDQHDITAVYSYLGRPGLKFRFGGHAIDTTDAFTDGAWTVLAGAHYYQTDLWDVGVDAYFTRYDNHPVNQDITQITPRVGIQQTTRRCVTVRLDLRGYYINTGDEVFGVGKEDFCSLEARWGLDRGRFGLALTAWTGEQVFAVRRDGFVIYNLAERHTGGYGGEFTFRVRENSVLTARISDEHFADIVSAADSHQLVSTFLWTHAF